MFLLGHDSLLHIQDGVGWAWKTLSNVPFHLNLYPVRKQFSGFSIFLGYHSLSHIQDGGGWAQKALSNVPSHLNLYPVKAVGKLFYSQTFTSKTTWESHQGIAKTTIIWYSLQAGLSFKKHLNCPNLSSNLSHIHVIMSPICQFITMALSAPRLIWVH